jgi:phage terminase small subunit
VGDRLATVSGSSSLTGAGTIPRWASSVSQAASASRFIKCMATLTIKQGIFVKEYLTDGNATRAAKAAGYSEKTADVQGSRLLANVKVRAEIDRQTEKRCEKLYITADYVLSGIRDMVERCRGQKKEFQPFAALKGYELLDKHLKLFTDKAEITGTAGRCQLKRPYYPLPTRWPNHLALPHHREAGRWGDGCRLQS